MSKRLSPKDFTMAFAHIPVDEIDLHLDEMFEMQWEIEEFELNERFQDNY